MHWEQIKTALDEEVILGEVCGLSVRIVPKRGFQKKYALLGVRYGANDISFRYQGKVHRTPSGIAHFLEHLLFEQEEDNAFRQFAAQTASTNAYTTHTQTVYLFSCTDYFFKNLKLLFDFVHHPYFPEETVEKEKKVISEEIAMEMDNPHWRVYQQLLEALFVSHPVRLDIAGTKQSIQEITKESLQLVYEAFYHPANMVLVIVGDVPVEEIFTFLEDFYKAYSFKEFNTEVLFPKEPEGVAASKKETKLEVSRPQLLLGYKHLPLEKSSEERILDHLAMSFALELLFGRRNDCFRKWYDQGLVDEGFSYAHHLERDYEITLVGSETSDPKRLEEELMKRIEELRQKGFEDKEFQLVKRKAQGRFISSLDNLGFLAQEFVDLTFWDFLPLRYPELMEQLTKEQCYQALERLKEQNKSVSLILPKKAN